MAAGSASTRSPPSWAELEDDMLEEILRRLTLRDCLRFGATCKRWHRVQLQHQQINPRPTQFPWILCTMRRRTTTLGFLNRFPDITSTTTFWSPSDGVSLNIELPQEKECRLLYCSASYGGWLLMVTPRERRVAGYRSHLFNPVTKSRITLPEVPDARHHRHLDHYRACMSSDPDEDIFCTIAIPTASSSIYFCRVSGNRAWTECNCKGGVIIRSMTFCNGLLYALCNRDLLLAIDPRRRPALSQVVPLKNYSTRSTCYQQEHLVESLGEVFLVRVAMKSSNGIGKNKPPSDWVRIQVLKANLAEMEWQEVTSLGDDRVMFVGGGSCVSTSAAGINGEKNHVYLAVIIYDDIHSFACWLDFDLERGTVTHCRPPIRTYDKLLYFRSLWIQPTLIGRSHDQLHVNPN